MRLIDVKCVCVCVLEVGGWGEFVGGPATTTKLAVDDLLI